MKTYRITYTPRAFGPFADADAMFASANYYCDAMRYGESLGHVQHVLESSFQPAVIEHYQARVVEVQGGA